MWNLAAPAAQTTILQPQRIQAKEGERGRARGQSHDREKNALHGGALESADTNPANNTVIPPVTMVLHADASMERWHCDAS